MATAIRASVRGSMAAETSGTGRVIWRLSEAVVSDSLGMTDEWAGSSSTSSKVRAGGANVAPWVISAAGGGKLAMSHPSEARAPLAPGSPTRTRRAPGTGPGGRRPPPACRSDRPDRACVRFVLPEHSRHPAAPGSMRRGNMDPGGPPEGIRTTGENRSHWGRVRRSQSGDPLVPRDLPEPGQRPVLGDAHRPGRHAERVAGLLGRQAGEHAEHQELALVYGKPAEQGPGPPGPDGGRLTPGRQRGQVAKAGRRTRLRRVSCLLF